MAEPIKSGSLYHAVNGYGTSIGVSVSTTGTDKQLFAFAISLQGTEPSISGGGLTWIKLGEVEANAAGGSWASIYTARAATAITAQTITATMTGDGGIAIFVQAWADSQDYTSLVANTDFGIGEYAVLGDISSSPSVSVTTIEADSELIGISGMFGTDATGYTAVTNVANVDAKVDGYTLAERSDGPLAIGSYSIGINHGATDNWKASAGIFVEILGTAVGVTYATGTYASNNTVRNYVSNTYTGTSSLRNYVGATYTATSSVESYVSATYAASYEIRNYASATISLTASVLNYPSGSFTGTITASTTETDVINGGKTIILTLTGDTWIA